jgi:hypothetical protein
MAMPILGNLLKKPISDSLAGTIKPKRTEFVIQPNLID